MMVDLMTTQMVTRDYLDQSLKDLRNEIDLRFKEIDARFNELELRLTIKLGAMMVLAIGVVATLIKIL